MVTESLHLQDDPQNEEDVDPIRKALRERLLVNAILKDGENLIIEGTFDGYGDSGTVSIDHEDTEVQNFLTSMVEQHVDFDWYNNEGGGGDITWHVQKNKIIINGYYNIVERYDEMVEEEF